MVAVLFDFTDESHLELYRNMVSGKVLVLLSGFRRTGKDTFQRGLEFTFHPGLHLTGNTPCFQWVVLGDDASQEKVDLLHQNKHVIVKTERVAFADLLKDEVHKTLGLPLHERDPVWLEANKDTFLFGSKTLRQHYIDTAMIRRENDPTYWVRKAMEKVETSFSVASCPTGLVTQLFIVTDWRFPNEEEYIRDLAEKKGYEVLTYRLFRPDVPIPPKEEISERSLDSVKTDLLLVPVGTITESFTEVMKLWPQYADYRELGESHLPIV